MLRYTTPILLSDLEPRQQALAVEADVPAAADVPLALVVEPQAPPWA